MKGSRLPLTNLDKVLIVCSTQTFARCFAAPLAHRHSSYQPPKWEGYRKFFGASVAHNNHKIGVNP